MLKNEGGEAVGAFVVGRSIEELNKEISKAVLKIAFFTLFIISVVIKIVFIII